MRFASSGENCEISLKVGTCRSGMMSTCVSAFALMSLIATKPSPRRTWSPTSTSRQKRQSAGTEDPIRADAGCLHLDEIADRGRAFHDPGRVVVAVAPAGPVDE